MKLSGIVIVFGLSGRIFLLTKESKIKPWLYVLEGSERNSVRDISTSSRRKIADSTKWARLVEGSYRAANA